jgi:glycosyltransferase involved in cell wall biosynthesis
MTSVSVITPSYNQAQYIRDTIVSVKNQQFNNISHIIIDGESDDGTVDILRQHEEIDWISESDRGQTHAINKGFDRADGDIVGWLNSDDLYVYKDTIESIVEIFEETHADIVFGHAITIGPSNELLRSHYIPKLNIRKLKRNCYIIQPSVFFRRNIIKNNKLNENRNYSMDYEYWLDLAEQYDWYRYNNIISADRNHPNRKIIQNSEASYADTQMLRKERGINEDYIFSFKQFLDKIDIRWRRVRMLPQLLKLYRKPEEQLAFDLVRPPLLSLLRTQLFHRKKQL